MKRTLEESQRRFDYEMQAEALVITITESHLRNEVDAQIMQYQVAEIVRETGSRLVVIDFSNVRFFSSAFVGTLLMLRKLLLAIEGRLAIAGMCVPLDEILRVMRLDQLLKSYTDVEAAIIGEVGLAAR